MTFSNNLVAAQRVSPVAAFARLAAPYPSRRQPGDVGSVRERAVPEAPGELVHAVVGSRPRLGKIVAERGDGEHAAAAAARRFRRRVDAPQNARHPSLERDVGIQALQRRVAARIIAVASTTPTQCCGEVVAATDPSRRSRPTEAAPQSRRRCAASAPASPDRRSAR